MDSDQKVVNKELSLSPGRAWSVSSRGVGGSGHGYNSLLQPAGKSAQSFSPSVLPIPPGTLGSQGALCFHKRECVVMSPTKLANEKLPKVDPGYLAGGLPGRAWSVCRQIPLLEPGEGSGVGS